MFLLEDFQDGQCCSTCHMVSPEGSAQLAINGLEGGGDEHSSHRESVADAFGHGNQVGTYAQPLVGKELAASAISALDFITDEEGSVLVTCFQ